MRLETERLELVSLSVDTVDAMIAADTAELLNATGARFPTPFQLPPLFDRDTLGQIRDQLDRQRHDYHTCLLILKETSEPVGVAGLSPAGEPATVLLGYSIYPAFEGRGLATEGAGALVKAGLRNGASRVRATIPPDHKPSMRVAEKLGMQPAGTAVDGDVGEVLVFEIAE